MKIFTFRIVLNEITEPKDIKPVGVDINDDIIFSYKINDDTKYKKTKAFGTKQIIIMLEIIKNYSLWETSYKINSYTINKYDISYQVNISNFLIKEDIINSLGLNYVLLDKFDKLDNITDIDLLNQSYISTQKLTTPLNNFKLELYPYQKSNLAKMLSIETKRRNIEIEYTYDMNISDISFCFDPFTGVSVNDKKYYQFEYKGGILADEMGLGKTITCGALIITNPLIHLDNFNTVLKINSKSSYFTSIL
jgi:SNF2 family DNA or RNA helicase